MNNDFNQHVTGHEMSDWFKIGEKCKESLPVLHEIWNDLCTRCGFLPDDHVLSELRRLIRSSILLGQHAIYSSLCVARYSKTEASNTYEDYVQYYIYNFIGRVKSSSDILALIVNHVYELGIVEVECALERGPIVGHLDSDGANRDLAALINRARQQWLLPFYDMRNIVVHRSGLRFVVGNVGGASLINIEVGEMLRIQKERKIIERFLEGIGIVVSKAFIVEPVILCENLWDQWRALAETIMLSIQEKICDFIDTNM